MAEIRTGFAEVNITLQNEMDMTGYLGRLSGPAGVHDDLKVKCVIFDDGRTKFILMVCDLLGLGGSFTKECINEISGKLGVQPENIVIACIHTHSGPASIFLQDCGEVDDKWLESLKSDILQCADDAWRRLEPSRLVYKTAACSIGINRVAADDKARVEMTDKQAGILEIWDGEDSRIKSAIINYACHPVVLDERNSLYTRDYTYYLECSLREKGKYKDAGVMFANGCCGDINPVERGSFEVAEKLGRQLADSLLDGAAVQLGKSDFENGEIHVDSLKIPIVLDKVFESGAAVSGAAQAKNVAVEAENAAAEEINAAAEAKNAVAEAGYAAAEAKNAVAEAIMSNQKVRLAFEKWEKKMQAAADEGTLEYFIDADVKVVHIGGLAIVTLPFEAFHGIGLKIKENFGKNNTMVICYANGDYGYFPSSELYDAAEYETGMAFKFYGYPGPVARDAEDVLLNALKQSHW